MDEKIEAGQHDISQLSGKCFGHGIFAARLRLPTTIPFWACKMFLVSLSFCISTNPKY
jgi:hypothetical protein